MRHLVTIDDLNTKEVAEIFYLAERYLAKVSNCLSGRIVLNVFFESSTRTANSFEIAAKKLGASVINLSKSSVAMKKGESVSDTFDTLNNIAPDCIVVRVDNSGIPFTMVDKARSIIINAGDGCNEHPTQALIDAFTIRSLTGRVSGRKVAICGDILHSRVAHSNIKLLNMLGAEVRIISPPCLIPSNVPNRVMKFNNFKDGLKDIDVIMVVRLQYERMKGSFVPSKKEYYKIYGIDSDKLKYAKDDVIVMHPGPINRGVEISSEVADSNHSAILKQVKFSIPVRQAVFDFLFSYI